LGGVDVSSRDMTKRKQHLVRRPTRERGIGKKGAERHYLSTRGKEKRRDRILLN